MVYETVSVASFSVCLGVSLTSSALAEEPSDRSHRRLYPFFRLACSIFLALPHLIQPRPSRYTTLHPGITSIRLLVLPFSRSVVFLRSKPYISLRFGCSGPPFVPVLLLARSSFYCAARPSSQTALPPPAMRSKTLSSLSCFLRVSSWQVYRSTSKEINLLALSFAKRLEAEKLAKLASRRSRGSKQRKYMD